MKYGRKMDISNLLNKNIKSKAITLATLVTLTLAPGTNIDTVKAFGKGYLDNPSAMKNISGKWVIGVSGKSKDKEDYVGLTVKGNDYPAKMVSDKFSVRWIVEEKSGSTYTIALWDDKADDPSYEHGYYMVGELDRKHGVIPKDFWE